MFFIPINTEYFFLLNIFFTKYLFLVDNIIFHFSNYKIVFLVLQIHPFYICSILFYIGPY